MKIHVFRVNWNRIKTQTLNQIKDNEINRLEKESHWKLSISVEINKWVSSKMKHSNKRPNNYQKRKTEQRSTSGLWWKKKDLEAIFEFNSHSPPLLQSSFSLSLSLDDHFYNLPFFEKPWPCGLFVSEGFSPTVEYV